MAITNAQQFKQLVNPPMDGKRPGYRGDDAYGGGASTSKSSSSSSSGGNKSGGGGGGSNFSGGDDRRESYITDYSSQAKVKGGGKKTSTMGGAGDEGYDDFQYTKDNRTKAMEDKFKRDRGLMTLNLLRVGVPPANTPSFLANTVLNALGPFRNFGLKKNIDFFQFDPRTRKAREKYGLTAEGYQNYMRARLAGEIDAAGNPLNTGDEDKNPFIPLTTTSPIDEDANKEDENALAGTGMAFRFMNRGGMPMDAPTTGGIMDLETGRQMYFLGKLVKKATRAVKKIVKSPLGKAAILGGALYFGKGAKAKGIMGSLFGQAGSRVGEPFVPFKEGLLTKLGLTKGGGSLMPTALGGIALASLTPFLFSSEQEEEDDEQTFDRGRKLDIANIRANPYTFIPRRFAAEGGSMKEPVAKKTMPLIDMDGKEKDYRETGGFVDIGRMERADDVPARLSKNEFVFTADAVRNAGDGSVDKGAEVMYNMMKNLESGGEVSEESQGLEGARKMFQTSQRLEEVL